MEPEPNFRLRLQLQSFQIAWAPGPVPAPGSDSTALYSEKHECLKRSTLQAYDPTANIGLL